ncbi:hypothetical protein LTR15_010660 [Elasticomyces elasticus]|nr:hypothetical protein LTR15_010660 [Elasticomyces elasticus]
MHYELVGSRMIERVKRILKTRLARLRTKWARLPQKAPQMSRFLNLPPEIRNLIYEYTMTAKGTLFVQVRLYDFWSLSQYNLVVDSCPHCYNKSSICQYATLPVQPPITEVCRQLRAETITMFYAVNSFAVKTEGPSREANVDIFVRWSNAIGSHNRQAISRLYICDHKEPDRGKTVKEIMTKAKLSWAAGAVEARTSRLKVKEDGYYFWGLDQRRLLGGSESA